MEHTFHAANIAWPVRRRKAALVRLSTGRTALCGVGWGSAGDVVVPNGAAELAHLYGLGFVYSSVAAEHD
jgi:hypothetical protein